MNQKGGISYLLKQVTVEANALKDLQKQWNLDQDRQCPDALLLK